VLPGCASRDPIYLAPIDTELFCESKGVIIRSVPATDLPNICFSEFGAALVFSACATATISAFYMHVLYVVRLGAWEEVSRIATWSIVARMADIQTVRDFAVGQLVGCTMSQFGVPASVRPLPAKHAVLHGTEAGGLPWPTIVWPPDVDLRPEIRSLADLAPLGHPWLRENLRHSAYRFPSGHPA
jgi:hypothetical protein